MKKFLISFGEPSEHLCVKAKNINKAIEKFFEVYGKEISLNWSIVNYNEQNESHKEILSWQQNIWYEF